MNTRAANRTLVAVLVTCLAAFSGLGTALAHGGGPGGGGGGHGGGGGGHGGYGGRGGGYAGYGGYRGGYGGRSGYGGYRGGYGGYGGWGYGGLGIGLYFAALPFYYSTFWADGEPYYYADQNYYQWDNNVGQYQTVNPPADVTRQVAMQSPNLMAYPKNGQTDAQQATDKSACRTWAAAQSGFDPTQAVQAQASTTGSNNKQSDYMRAQAACLEGRGYSVQ